MHDKIFDMLVKDDEITWQTIIFDLVKEDKMDPWDIDITQLSQKFISFVRKLSDADFRISGRVILATAIFLRLKSNKLISEDLDELDKLFASNQVLEDEFYEELQQEFDGVTVPGENGQEYSLIPRTPQPRKRKISVFDLVDALNKALEVKERREGRAPGEAPEVKAPTKVIDISIVIKDILRQVQGYYSKNQNKLTFSQLLPSDSKEDKVYTFIPLLHLTNQRKIDIEQENHFGEINIFLLDNDVVAVENEEEHV